MTRERDRHANAMHSSAPYMQRPPSHGSFHIAAAARVELPKCLQYTYMFIHPKEKKHIISDIQQDKLTDIYK